MEIHQQRKGELEDNKLAVMFSSYQSRMIINFHYVKIMLEMGLVEETKNLINKYDKTVSILKRNSRLNGVLYKETNHISTDFLHWISGGLHSPRPVAGYNPEF